MSKHTRTWEAIYANPTLTNIPWRDIEAMLVYLGAEITEGNGSRIRVMLCGVPHVFHRPHPNKETGKGTVEDVRELLDITGVDKP